MAGGLDMRRTCPECGVDEGTLHRPGCKYNGVGNPNKPGLTIVTPIPKECEQYAPEIARFVEAMVYKLKVHSGKGKWDNYGTPAALDLLEGEVSELREAVAEGNMVEILLESADVANYALIIASKGLEK